MYLPRNLLSHLYTQLVRNTHPLSPPVLILVSLEPDALCACRILTALLKRDYIPHKVQPVAGYSDLTNAGRELVLPLTRQHGGDGGVVICLGVGGLVDLEELLGLDGSNGEAEPIDMQDHGVEVWLVDARRPWNLQNVFGFGGVVTAEEGAEQENAAAKRRRGVDQGKILPSYNPGRGGIIVFDDGDIERELSPEKDAFCTLQTMPDHGEEDDDYDDDDDDNDHGDEEGGDERRDELEGVTSRKRKSSSDMEDGDESDDDERPYQRRRSNSGSSIPSSPRPRMDRLGISNHPSSSQQTAPLPSSPPPPQSSQPSARTLRRRLLRLKRKHEATLQAYYALGTSYSEPMASMLYSLASELGREDNDLLWLAIVGVSAAELYGNTAQFSSAEQGAKRLGWSANRHEQIRDVMRDEVRRLNPSPTSEIARERDMGDSGGVIPTHARSPTDTSIRLSPEPRFLLIRHWSLYDSMLHSPYLSTRLHVWSEPGKKRLHKLLAKMGVSLNEAGKGYTHMDIELKRGLRERLLRFAPMYGLDGLVPPADGGRGGKDGWGFVRCWGWKACLSSMDVAVIIGAILEVGTDPLPEIPSSRSIGDRTPVSASGYNARMRALPTPPTSLNGEDSSSDELGQKITDPDWTTNRFFAAYDALSPSSSSLSSLLSHVPTAQHLHRAILRTGSALIGKHQIRHLRAFRMGVVREGPDVPLFIHPGALVKLANWVSEAVGVLEAEKGVRDRGALVLAALDERRSVYVVVGLGGAGGAAGSGRMRSRAEMKEREERKKARAEKKAEKALQKEIRRQEKKRLLRERNEANGIFIDDSDNDDDDEEEDNDTESSSSSDSSDSDSDSEDEESAQKRKKRGHGLNRFGAAFQEVVDETNARVRIDSFEHSVVEVKRDDFSGFLEALSLKSVVG
ncbi:hypothetical protein AAFC00_006801 [Neodothiora populina]|uniref:CDC45-like protein n=1 Tax=Neodothiora populina TaxID=2781224 RepID=A0ABR3PBG4_9PEZI